MLRLLPHFSLFLSLLYLGDIISLIDNGGRAEVPASTAAPISGLRVLSTTMQEYLALGSGIAPAEHCSQQVYYCIEGAQQPEQWIGSICLWFNRVAPRIVSSALRSAKHSIRSNEFSDGSSPACPEAKLAFRGAP